MFKKYKGLGQILFVMSMALIMPNIAHAADIFAVPNSDLSKILFLDVLFPSDLGQSPLAGVMLVFNSLALILGGVLAAYTLIAGTMQTAHDGEMLGKKWSSMWLPIRMSIGTALLIPAAGGFCAAQVLVLWMITQGVGFADKLWSAYTNNMDKTVAYSGTPNGDKVYMLANNILASNFCMIAAQQQSESFDAEDKYKSGSAGSYTFYAVPDESDANKKLYNYGKASTEKGSWWKFWGSAEEESNACGTVSVPNPSTTGGKAMDTSDNASDASDLANLANNMGSVFGGNYSYLDANGKKNLASVFSSVYTAQQNQLIALDNKMKALAQQIYNADDTTKLDVGSNIDSAVRSYQAAINSATASAFNGNSTWDTFKQAMDTQGWLMAGTWYINVSRYQNLISRVATTLPEASGMVNPEKIFNDEKYIGKVNKFFQKMRNVNANSPYVALNLNKQITDPKTEKNAEGEDYSFFQSKIIGQFSPITSILANVLNLMSDKTNDTDPLSVAIAFGNIIDDTAWTVFIGFGVLAIFLKSAALLGAVMPFLVPLWLFAIILSEVIPFTPYLMWMGVIAGWMIICIEAMIGAPLWIVTHLHPDADGVVGKGGAGYGMVLSLMMRPALMVFGLICAMLILPILINLVNVSFGSTFASIASTVGGTSVSQAMGIMAIYTMLILTMVKKSFSLIHIIPDEIMKWLGVNVGSRMSEHSNELGAVARTQALQTVLDQSSRMAGASSSIAREIENSREKNMKGGANGFNNQLGQIGSSGNSDSPVSSVNEATGLDHGEMGDSASNAEELYSQGHDLSASANEREIDNFSKTYPTAEHMKNAPKDKLAEMYTRSAILDAQIQKAAQNPSWYGRGTRDGFRSETGKTSGKNRTFMGNIDEAMRYQGGRTPDNDQS